MVHQYKLNGCNIVIDTCSGSIHSVDEVAYDIIAMYETKDHDEIVSTILSRYADRASCGTYLQSELLLLLRFSGQIPRGTCTHVL